MGGCEEGVLGERRTSWRVIDEAAEVGWDLSF